MEEAERLCDRIVIVDHGHVLADDTLARLLDRVPATNRVVIELEQPIDERTEAKLRALTGIGAIQRGDRTWTADVLDLGTDATTILRALAEDGLAVRGIRSERPSLESVFLTLTGRSLRDA